MLASRLHWRLLIGTILALMAVAWLAPRFVPAPDIQENRVLAPSPPWPHRLVDVLAFRKAADPYVADHFPARPYLIGALNRMRMFLGVGGSNRVIIGRKGWLFYDDDTHLGAARGDPPMEEPEIHRWLSNLAGRTEMLKARGVTYMVVVAPVKETIYPQFGPWWYGGPSPRRPAMFLPRAAREAQIGDIFYLYPAVAEATRRGPQTYSLHDTHWNAYGAYAGYVGLMNRLHAMGLTDGPKPLSDFAILQPAPGRGPRDLALMLGVSSFVHLDFAHIAGGVSEPKLSTTYLTPKHDWTGAQIIDTGLVGKPTLLMTRDSFSNELEPLLYSHFSRLILAHNQDGFWRPDLIDRFKPDIVLLEVIEPGLRVGMGGGPTPSPRSIAQIDRVLSRLAPAPSAAPLLATLRPADAKILAITAAAKPTNNCNIEVATLKPGEKGEATFTGSGWLSELGTRVTAPEGLVALKGPGGLFVSPIRMDTPRPDVAAFFKNPTGAASGFVGTFFIERLPAGTYTPSVYRRAGAGWIGCQGKLSLSAP